MRDKDIDDEMLALYKSRPNLVVNPNLPDRGVKQDMSWLKSSLPAAEYAKIEEGNTDRPKAAGRLRHSGPQPGEDQRRRREDRARDRRQPGLGLRMRRPQTWWPPA